MENPYKTLGLGVDSTLKNLNDRYKILAKRSISDMANGSNHTENFDNITEAYVILSNQVYKKEFDEYLLNVTERKAPKYGVDFYAKVFVLKKEILSFYSKVQENKDDSLYGVKIGFLWLIAGGVLSLLSLAFSEINNQTSYFIFGGAILLGGKYIIKGVENFNRLKSVIKKMEVEFWDNLLSI